MKQIQAALLIAACAANYAAAQSTTYEPQSGDLVIPCVNAVNSTANVGVYAPYEARLRRSGTSHQYTLQYLRPTVYDTDCSGSFDTATNVYRDVVNIGDESFTIRMRRGADNLFTTESLAPRGPAQTSLWVARNGNNVVYLAGTIHVLRNSDYPLPRAYDEAYAKSSALYFEIDMDDPVESGQGLSAEQSAQIMRDPEGKTLAQTLRPATWTQLRDYLQRTWNVPIENVNQWSAQMFVSAYSYGHLDVMNGVGANGVDRYLANRATADRKPVIGPETAASQYRVIQALDEGREDELVREFLESIASGSNIADFDQLVRLWRSGDTTTMNREQLVPMREHDSSDYQLLQLSRNNAWMPQLEKLLQTPETEMVVVGVAHMAGTDGLVAQLRRRGYHVEKY